AVRRAGGIMRTRHILGSAASVVAVAALAAGGAAGPALAVPGRPAGLAAHGDVRHVLLISVDGLHQQDPAWYGRHFPGSALAAPAGAGVEYSNAQTPVPSDSFPGLIGQVTGGDPRVTGIYYDDTWNHQVFPAGTSDCSGPVPGGEVAYTEADDINQ